MWTSSGYQPNSWPMWFGWLTFAIHIHIANCVKQFTWRDVFIRLSFLIAGPISEASWGTAPLYFKTMHQLLCDVILCTVCRLDIPFASFHLVELRNQKCVIIIRVLLLQQQIRNWWRRTPCKFMRLSNRLMDTGHYVDGCHLLITICCVLRINFRDWPFRHNFYVGQLTRFMYGYLRSQTVVIHTWFGKIGDHVV